MVRASPGLCMAMALCCFHLVALHPLIKHVAVSKALCSVALQGCDMAAITAFGIKNLIVACTTSALFARFAPLG